PATNTGATKIFSLAFYSQNSSLVYDTNEISNKLVNQYLDLQIKISANANLISNNSLVFIPNRNLVTGEAL
ncbi:hypothetical protein, partial [Emticicia sp. W12TSBA100-4]|uniref:hypothetical protein n=1 Tax=Emticicia sp. W12TSBA100-4 TaxID=3160965 RepID=UPI0033058B8A